MTRIGAPRPTVVPSVGHGATGVEIAGLGHFAPEKVVTSAELERDMGLEAGWIARRTGIVERRYASEGEALTDIAARAAEMALADAARRSGVAKSDVALMLLATSTPDHLLPPSAPLLVHRLGLANAGGIDLAGACSGFLYALVLADAFVKTQRASVVVVAANILSRRINPADRGSAVLFADAAGAVLLRPTERTRAGLRGVKLAASGGDYGLIQIPAGGSRRPFSADVPIMDTRMVLADGKAVYQKAVRMMEESARAALKAAGAVPEDVTHFIPHQANARMIETLRAGLGIGAGRARSTIAEYGNSSAATIPFTLSFTAAEGERPAAGDVVLMAAAGAGLSGGALVWVM